MKKLGIILSIFLTSGISFASNVNHELWRSTSNAASTFSGFIASGPVIFGGVTVLRPVAGASVTFYNAIEPGVLLTTKNVPKFTIDLSSFATTNMGQGIQFSSACSYEKGNTAEIMIKWDKEVPQKGHELDGK